jgi:hypothetical protein
MPTFHFSIVSIPLRFAGVQPPDLRDGPSG